MQRRVLLISQLPPPVHGSTLMTEALMDTLHDLGYHTCLVDRRFSSTIDEVGKISVRKALALPSLMLRLTTAVIRPTQVCIFFTTNRGASFVVDYALAHILGMFKVPYISYVHTYGYTDLAARGRVWERMVRRILGASEKVVVLSQSLTADVAPWTSSSRIEVIENTSPGDGAVSEASNSTASSPTVRVLYLSNLIPEKGVLDFIRMARQIALHMPTVPMEFDIVGAATTESFQQRIQYEIDEAARGLVGQRFHLRGPQHGASKWRYLREADVLVFPSRYPYEAQPLTLIEALAVGTPIVAYPTGGIPDLITDGVDGLLVDSVSEGAEAVVSLLRDPVLSAKMGVSAAETYESRFSRKAFATKWSNVLRDQQLRAAGQK